MNNPVGSKITQGTIEIKNVIEAFLRAKQAEGLSDGTIGFYKKKLAHFLWYCNESGAENVEDISADLLREYMLSLKESGHNPGGVHCFYRSVKSMLRWYELEFEPDNWKNPINRIKGVKIPLKILEPISVENFNALIGVCADDLRGRRDRAILLTLFDSGLRASELLNLNLDDFDAGGAVQVSCGKGGKSRVVFIGHTTKKALRRYLRMREDDCEALFVGRFGERLTYDGLRAIITRRANDAGINPVPSLHSFRRAFALTMLRNGCDVYSLQRLMGHSDLQVLRRYLALENGDIQAAHVRSSPVDNSPKNRKL